MHSLANIDAFVRAVEEGDFTQAAKKLHLTASAVSRRISRLEEELGVKLFQRTTRALRLTEDGRDFHARCQRLLADLEDAKESLSRSREQPAGRLRVEAPQVIGQLVLAPALPPFLARHPGLELHLTLRDTVVDPVAEGADVLLRLGRLEDSRLVARKLGTARLVACASPEYLARRGTPATPADLARHDCLGFLRDGASTDWLLREGDEALRVLPRGSFHTNHGATLRDAALMGLGIAWLFDFMVARELAAGALVRVLESSSRESRPIHVLHPPAPHLPARVRVFLDFVATLFPAAKGR
ncbi:LysR family transcriptional regulator [Myxococcus stipitatus DSM 14675]|uniref:LysR family transcriptional regulator n=1 Tax=Myxococcus stipitatus (strain DSM 14675 / JCM 12634 / Mx s8) TaxID=1278073 RepID=L7U778_MYXSD|nr:LysR family transcriptional regulator [Myxococcus stipitatus]AGC43923.1 LysR family transcriptional regulator [Myxococcus stipitatus DSM 14675]